MSGPSVDLIYLYQPTQRLNDRRVNILRNTIRPRGIAQIISEKNMKKRTKKREKRKKKEERFFMT
jgi:hypothetical protein